MKQIGKIKELSFGFIGLLGMVLLFVVGMIFVVGFAKLIEFLMPVIATIAVLGIVMTFFVFIPISFVKSLRLKMAKCLMVTSDIAEVYVYLVSFVLIILYFGGWGLVSLFVAPFLVPIAIVGSLFNYDVGGWVTSLFLVLIWGFVFGIRLYAISLHKKTQFENRFADICDGGLEVEVSS